jgi:hypothetical protein
VTDRDLLTKVLVLSAADASAAFRVAWKGKPSFAERAQLLLKFIQKTFAIEYAKKISKMDEGQPRQELIRLLPQPGEPALRELVKPFRCLSPKSKDQLRAGAESYL